jgi:4-hydroxyphenylpyruvate dioxygenase
MEPSNYCGLEGIEFIEYASPDPKMLDTIFKDFGFSKTKKHANKNIFYYNQNDIHFLINKETNSFGEQFYLSHGPSISSISLRVADRNKAFEEAVKRGAKPATEDGDYKYKGEAIPAVYGIGDSLIYFIDDYKDKDLYNEIGFADLDEPCLQEPKGFLAIDHFTNNVEKGTMGTWAEFYKNVFGFTEIRYFDIKGEKTGLISFALQSPCKTFCIPLNEGTEDKSQINEYLREYKGAGIQHIAFLTDDILMSLDKMKDSSIKTLDIDDEYYAEVFDRVPNVTEDQSRIRNHNVLIDGDDEGYLLQIFTKNLVGPIFIEIIQRKNHHSFGEGNFGALFRSIEKDQEDRGVL